MASKSNLYIHTHTHAHTMTRKMFYFYVLIYSFFFTQKKYIFLELLTFLLEIQRSISWVI